MTEIETTRPTSKIIHELPATGMFAYLMGRLWMRFFGWDFSGHKKEGKKFLLIAAPHTSNWDVPFMLAATFCYRVKISWMGKHTLFKKPFGTFMRAVGGIPIDRNNPHGIVEQAVEAFNKSERLVLSIAAPATREKKDYWKSGFYWIAYKAQVPIVCGFLDYKRKLAGIGPHFIPTGDIKKDMDKIREFYKDIKGKYPENQSRIKLREEEE